MRGGNPQVSACVEAGRRDSDTTPAWNYQPCGHQCGHLIGKGVFHYPYCQKRGIKVTGGFEVVHLNCNDQTKWGALTTGGTLTCDIPTFGVAGSGVSKGYPTHNEHTQTHAYGGSHGGCYEFYFL